MRKALSLAQEGVGYVSPNPLVGCVIVGQDGKIVGEGAHHQFGGPHAEPNAIADAESNGHTVAGSTAYVTLEPHSHHGKTPPCCDLLIEKRIARCIVAMVDPNPNVSGEGIRRMREAGILVEVGLLEAEARELNRFFIKHITTGLPYLTLKVASSLDGRSALASGESKWITSEASRKMVHKLRAEHDAVMVGTGTARADDPALTVRLVEGRQPRRIVLDPQLQLPHTLSLLTDEYHEKTIVVTSQQTVETGGTQVQWLRQQGVEIIAVPAGDGRLDLNALLKKLGDQGISSIVVEAGPTLAASIVHNKLFDEMQLFVAPLFLGAESRPSIGGLSIHSLASAVRYSYVSIDKVEDSLDFLVRVRV